MVTYPITVVTTATGFLLIHESLGNCKSLPLWVTDLSAQGKVPQVKHVTCLLRRSYKVVLLLMHDRSAATTWALRSIVSEQQADSKGFFLPARDQLEIEWCIMSVTYMGMHTSIVQLLMQACWRQDGWMDSTAAHYKLPPTPSTSSLTTPSPPVYSSAGVYCMDAAMIS